MLVSRLDEIYEEHGIKDETKKSSLSADILFSIGALLDGSEALQVEDVEGEVTLVIGARHNEVNYYYDEGLGFHDGVDCYIEEFYEEADEEADDDYQLRRLIGG